MKTNSLATTTLQIAFILTFAHAATAQIGISSVTNSGYHQDFDTLSNSGTNNAWSNDFTLPGWHAAQESSPFVVTNYRASMGSDNIAGAIFSFGSAASTDRALGSLPTGTPDDLAFGVRFTNDTSRAMSNITLHFAGEQWRRTTAGSTQTLGFSYGIARAAITNADPTGVLYSWTSFPALNFDSPNLGATGALDGNEGTNRQILTGSLTGVLLLPGEELFLRWLDVDDPSINDYGLAIDDLSVSFTPVAFSDPAITAPPVNQTNAVHTTATFSVAASGFSTLHYQWYRGASPLADGVNISGATNDVLRLAQIVHDDAGSYSVVVSNTAGSVTSAPVTLAVVGFAIAPVPPTNTVAGQPVTVGLSFIDNQGPVTGASGTSTEQAILPDAGIAASAAGSAGMVTLTPAQGTAGVVLTTLSASDGSFSTHVTFPLLVVPGTNVLFNDCFGYADGPLTTASHDLWCNHSGPAGESIITGGELQVSRSLDEDVSAGLIGAPYPTNCGAVLYSRLKVRFTAAPAASGNYFAHFKDDASNSARGRIWVSTNSGSLRLAIGNASGSIATSTEHPMNLELGTQYTVVSRMALSNGVCSLWINPASESDSSVTANDTPAGLVPINSYAFRQAGSMGVMRVDDLVIGRSFESVMTSPAPGSVPLSIVVTDGDAIVSWTDGSGLLKLASGTNVTEITNVVSTTSPYTNAISGSSGYFRLIYP